MAEFDQVLARIQNQLDKMKKSLDRDRIKELARVMERGRGSDGLTYYPEQDRNSGKKVPAVPPHTSAAND